MTTDVLTATIVPGTGHDVDVPLLLYDCISIYLYIHPFIHSSMQCIYSAIIYHPSIASWGSGVAFPKTILLLLLQVPECCWDGTPADGIPVQSSLHPACDLRSSSSSAVAAGDSTLDTADWSPKPSDARAYEASCGGLLLLLLLLLLLCGGSGQSSRCTHGVALTGGQTCYLELRLLDLLLDR